MSSQRKRQSRNKPNTLLSKNQRNVRQKNSSKQTPTTSALQDDGPDIPIEVQTTLTSLSLEQVLEPGEANSLTLPSELLLEAHSDGSHEAPIDVEEISVGPPISTLLEAQTSSSLSFGFPTQAFEILESIRDREFGMMLPVKVKKFETLFESNTTSRAAGAWGVLSSTTQGHICRFCGQHLGKREPNLSAIGHFLGEAYYRKRGLQRKSSNPETKCSLVPPVAVERARRELQKFLNPASKPTKIGIELPSTQLFSNPSSGTSLSWSTPKSLYTQGLLLMARECLPYSLWNSEEFRKFLNIAIELGKSRLPPISSYYFRQHSIAVYTETKIKVSEQLHARSGPLHLFIDSCTFNTTKNIFNVLVSDERREWYLGHAKIDNLISQDAVSHLKLYSAALDMVEKFIQSSEISLITPEENQSSSSLYDQIVPVTSRVEIPAASEKIFSHPVATIVTDGAPVNKRALELLSHISKCPEVIGLVCTAHGLNLLMKHLVKKTEWMKTQLQQVIEIIKYFRNKSRPRAILRLAHPKQLRMPASTRFCYAVLTLQSFLSAGDTLKKLGTAALTPLQERTTLQTEWIRLREDLSGAEKKSFDQIQILIGDSSLYLRADSLLRILSPIYSVLRIFDSSCPDACGWIFCAILHLRHLMHKSVLLVQRHVRRRLPGPY